MIFLLGGLGDKTGNRSRAPAQAEVRRCCAGSLPPLCVVLIAESGFTTQTSSLCFALGICTS